MSLKKTAVRRIQFCAGHRVMGHENKCRNLHGHNYVVFFHAEAEQLDSIGRVIDFSVLKEKLGGWIDKHWDHTFIVHYLDDEVLKALDQIKDVNREIYVIGLNPTAENMAEFLLRGVCPDMLKDTGVTVTKVELWETENCYAVSEL